MYCLLMVGLAIRLRGKIFFFLLGADLAPENFSFLLQTAPALVPLPSVLVRLATVVAQSPWLDYLSICQWRSWFM